MLKINGVTIKSPKSFSVDIGDIDGDSNRNANGDLLRDRIAVKRKLNCEWAPLTTAEISVILQAVQSVFFEVEYPDPMTGNRQSKTFYVGDRTAPLYWIDEQGRHLWQGLIMNFIEQ